MQSTNIKIPRIIQKDNFSCIPACLEQVLLFNKNKTTQTEIINKLEYPERGMSLPQAGTFLKKQGLKTTICTNNIYLFDPTWFALNNKDLCKKLTQRKSHLDEFNASLADDYIAYLKNDGNINFETISASLITKYLASNQPIIAEIASTFLYKKSKTTEPGEFNNSIEGDIEGHGVVIAGNDNNTSNFKIVDPGKYNPYSEDGIYWIDNNNLIASIFLAEGKAILCVE